MKKVYILSNKQDAAVIEIMKKQIERSILDCKICTILDSKNIDEQYMKQIDHAMKLACQSKAVITVHFRESAELLILGAVYNAKVPIIMYSHPYTNSPKSITAYGFNNLSELINRLAEILNSSICET